MDLNLASLGCVIDRRPGITTELDIDYAAAVARMKAAKPGAAVKAGTLWQAIVRFFGSGEPRLQTAA